VPPRIRRDHPFPTSEAVWLLRATIRSAVAADRADVEQTVRTARVSDRDLNARGLIRRDVRGAGNVSK
jgi:hypothetical protein